MYLPSDGRLKIDNNHQSNNAICKNSEETKRCLSRSCLVSRKDLRVCIIICNRVRSIEKCSESLATSTISREIAGAGSSRSLPNASFAFTRASLIACIPLVAFAIFLQKFSSSLSGISAKGARDSGAMRGMRFSRASRGGASMPRVSHAVISPGSRALLAGCHVKITVAKTLRPQRRQPSPAAPAH